MKSLNPIKALKNYLKSKDDEWVSKLYSLGFDKVAFPIIIKDGADLDIIYSLRDFSTDPDLYFHEFDQNMEMIDSNGKLWEWKYDTNNKTNLPGRVKNTLTLNEVATIISRYFNNTKIEQEVQSLISNASTSEELIEAVADKF